MQEVNYEVKGTLAKLLATENLNVEHRKITTAYFDVQNRVLALPIWKNVSNDVYDLLVGHEVGHALYTPLYDWNSSSAPKDFINVVEDARIERKMKITYPGLKKSFYHGYVELNDQDFFGVKDKDLSELSFIDRINLHFKIGGIGNTTMIPFSREEIPYVNMVATTISFEDVIRVAEEIFKYCKEKNLQKVEELPNVPNSGNSSNENEDTEYNPVSQDTVEGDQQQSQSSGYDDDEEYEDPQENSGSFGAEYSSELESVTDRNWNDRQHELVDESAKEWIYLDLPTVDLDEVIISWKTVHDDLNSYFSTASHTDPRDVEVCKYVRGISVDKFNEYKKDAGKSVNYLVKQFEMKKSADNYKRSSTSRTGILDTTKLFKYKYSEDIFKKVSVVTDGKNHGLVMHIDWSGSMADCLIDTLKQLYNLIWFCKKVSIPFRVYAFQSAGQYQYGADRYNNVYSKKANTLGLVSDFLLLELFSSKMNSKTLDQQMKLVWMQSWGLVCSYSLHGSYAKYTLGGTPLSEAVLCTRKIVNDFKKNENVQKVNVVILSDGESNPISYTKQNVYSDRIVTEYLCHNRDKVFIVRDPVTKYSRKFDSNPYDSTKEIVSYMKQVTDYNWIGIRLATKQDLNRMVGAYAEGYMTMNKINDLWSSQRYVSLGSCTGFTEMFVMNSRQSGDGTHEIDVKQRGAIATKSEIQKAFVKHMGSKMTNKTLLNRFVDQIC